MPRTYGGRRTAFGQAPPARFTLLALRSGVRSETFDLLGDSALHAAGRFALEFCTHELG